MEEYAKALADAVDAALPGWVERSVVGVLLSQGLPVEPEVKAAAAEAGRRAQMDVGTQMRKLLSEDIDAQWTTPLALLRKAVCYPTEVLRVAGARPVDRDDYARERFPDDVFDLSPASFADVDASLHEPGMEWGAAKAWTHKHRHES